MFTIPRAKLAKNTIDTADVATAAAATASSSKALTQYLETEHNGRNGKVAFDDAHNQMLHFNRSSYRSGSDSSGSSSSGVQREEIQRRVMTRYSFIHKNNFLEY